MWIFLIHVVIALGLGITYAIVHKKYKATWKYRSADDILGFLWRAFLAVLVAHIIIISILHLSAKEDLIRKQLEREAIVYEINNGNPVVESLSEFNTDVNYHKRHNKNPWTSWYYPSWIDEIELIPTEVE